MPKELTAEYRCDLTVDLEEIISMQQKHENIEAIAVYKSGREEIVRGKLKKDGTAYKTFNEKVEALRKFPTVTSVTTRTF